LSSVNGIIAVGPDPQNVISQFNAGADAKLKMNWPRLGSSQTGQAIVWQFSESNEPVRVNIQPAKAELRRHRRKYAAGELGEDKSFYFRGADKKLNLRAQNMNMFAQLAEGVDDETWGYHLAQSDYSRWLREAVKDQTIAEEVQRAENDKTLSHTESRARILEAIRKHYTAPG
jgi:hypothetical protein